MHLTSFFDTLRQDLRYTARTLARSPGFTATVILVSALGIGATTAAFSVADRVLMHPLSFADSERLVQLWQRTPASLRFETSPPNFYDWRRMSTSFESMAAYSTGAWNFIGEGEPRRVDGTIATPDFFTVLGVRPFIGRVFTAEDTRPNAGRVVVLSYSFWQTAFAGDADILTKKIRLDNDTFTVIGVMPPAFLFPDTHAQLWRPLVLGDPPTDARDNLFLSTIAKLKPNVRTEAARSEMAVISGRLAQAFPKENDKVQVTVDPLSEQAPPQTRGLLWALLGASFCVLLIACTNLANLLLARAVARRKELAVRSALGAGRERLVRQLLTESAILALTGGGLGIAIAVAAIPFLFSIVPDRLPFTHPSALDPRVLMFTLLLTAGTGFAFGILPAWRVSRGVDQEGLREASRSGIGGGHRDRVRSALLVAEIAISLVLLISAGLLLRALWRVQSIDPGFRTESVVAIQTSLPMPRYALAATRATFYNEVLSKIRSLPGVTKAAAISSLPMIPGGGIWPIALGDTPANAAMRLVSPDYFATMGIPIREGRELAESDTLDAPPVAVVSESFARRYWPNQDALGRKFHFDLANFPFAEQDRTIVGIVGEVRFRGLERSNEPQVYLSYKQLPDRVSPFYAPREFVVQYMGDTAAIVPPIQRIIRAADAELPISAVRPMQDVVDQQTASRTAQMRLVAIFAALALFLAGTGIYGLLSFAVGQRSQEFGLRLALGADTRDICAMVVKEGTTLAAFGAVCGVVLSYFAGRAMEALLAGVGPLDPSALAAAAVFAVAMTLSGTIVPAIRAMRTDPAIEIRGE